MLIAHSPLRQPRRAMTASRRYLLTRRATASARLDVSDRSLEVRDPFVLAWGSDRERDAVACEPPKNRTWNVDACKRLRQRRDLAAEAAALEGDDADGAEIREVAFMECVRRGEPRFKSALRPGHERRGVIAPTEGSSCKPPKPRASWHA